MTTFNVPAPLDQVPGGLSIDTLVRQELSNAIKRCGKDRNVVAREMSELLGRKITLFMLNAYTADSRKDHNFPLNYVPAFEVATGSLGLTTLLAKARGAIVLVGEEALLAEIGQIERHLHELDERRRALHQRVRGER